MENKSLHTFKLEKVFGPIKGDIISQDKDIRVVHLKDKNGISRTLGVVRFSNVDSEILKVAHEKIMAGELLGKTLYEAGIDFDKEFIGSLEVKLPDWLKKDFNTQQDCGLAFFSKISIRGNSLSNDKILYSELIEIIPPGLNDLFIGKTKPLLEIDESLLSLIHAVDTIEINQREKTMISCIVIGAGPGGIVATKELLENGFNDALCLEQAGRLGGVFANSYDNLLLTSSVTFSMFSDFWVGEGKSHYFWTKDEAVAYWTAYATHYGVQEHLRFGAKVATVSSLNSDSWQISLESGETLQCKRLILAIGNNSIPKFPDWMEQLTDVPYTHSTDYKNANGFEGRRVLIVGGGESGSDVAYEIAQVAGQSWVSLRESTGWVVPRKRGDHAADVSTHRGIWDLPREYGRYLSPFVLKLERARMDPIFDALADLNDKVTAKNGIWGIFGTKTLALPTAIAHHGCKVVGGIVAVEDGGRRLRTAEGEVLDDIDLIVFCTGYINRVNFMPEELKACDPRQMYKHMFHPDFGDRLAWVGWARPGFGSQFPIMEMQSRYAALVFKGELKLPNAEDMIRIAGDDMKVYMEQFEANAQHIRSLIDYHRYMDGLARLMGCDPPLARYFLFRPRLWLHLMYGPTQATQFRLRGPGKKVKLSHEIIHKLPISTFNHIVKAGLRGRVRYALRALLPGSLLRKV